MNTINEKLEQLNCLYQQKVNYCNKLEKQILAYQSTETRKDDLEFSIRIKKYFFCCCLTFIGSCFCIVGIGKTAIPLNFIASVGITYILENIGLLDKIHHKLFRRERAELDALNLSLEKVDIEELKQQLEYFIRKEEKCRLDLEAFQREAEALANIPSEEEIMLEQQRKLEEREQNKMNFFQTHVLTEEEANQLNAVIYQEEIGPQKKIGEMK